MSQDQAVTDLTLLAWAHGATVAMIADASGASTDDVMGLVFAPEHRETLDRMYAEKRKHRELTGITA